MLNAYSRRKDGNALLSRSFRVREFACRDGSDPLFVDSALGIVIMEEAKQRL